MRPLTPSTSRFLLALAFLVAGCADAPDEAPVVEVRGVFLQPMYDGAAMLVEHEAIPGRMPAMQMAMRLERPALLDGLEEGAPITMTLDSASLDVVAVERLPVGTALDLTSDEGDGGIFAPE